MKKIAAIFVVALAFVFSYGVVKANYAPPMSLAVGAKASNLVVNRDDSGDPVARGSIVKIIDGCNVVYMSNAYIIVSNRIETTKSPTTPTQISVTNGCK